MILFDFLFYTLYLFFKNNEPKLDRFTDSSRAFNVSLILTVVYSINIMTVFAQTVKKEAIVGLVLFFGTLNYFMFYHNKRYIAIFNRFMKVVDKKNYLTGYIMVVIYLVASIVLFAITR